MKNSCNLLLNEIVFFYDAIGPCCSTTIHHAPLKMSINAQDNLDLSLDKFLSIRDSYIDMFGQKEKYNCAKNCMLYRPDHVDRQKSIQFSNIVISNRTKCSCNCIYCEQSGKNQDTKNFLNNHKPYNIMPLLKNLKNRGLISQECNFVISGGECAEYPKEELKWLREFIASYNGSLFLLSSGIFYSEEIARSLQTGKRRLTVSIDAGTKKIYEKIKRIKAYDTVWKNMAKYIKEASINKDAMVEIKYIVIPGINDNIDELKAFIKKCESIKCKNIKIEIEHFWLRENIDKPTPKHLKEFFKYYVESANNSDMYFDYEGVGKDWILAKAKEQL